MSIIGIKNNPVSRGKRYYILAKRFKALSGLPGEGVSWIF
jgi:hypothetical protein